MSFKKKRCRMRPNNANGQARATNATKQKANDSFVIVKGGEKMLCDAAVEHLVAVWRNAWIHVNVQKNQTGQAV